MGFAKWWSRWVFFKSICSLCLQQNQLCNALFIDIPNELIDCLQLYVPLKTFSFIWRRHHCRWRAAKFRLRVFKQEGSLSCYSSCDMGPQFFRSHPNDRTIQSPFTTHKGMWRIYCNLDSHRSLISRLLRHTKGYGGPITTRILTALTHIELTHKWK
jgi:hypothetical protein